MINVSKRNGRLENFDRNKIAHSVQNAGLNERMAKEVASMIPKREGISSDEIRKLVSYEIEARDKNAARRYEEWRRLVVKSHFRSRGVARLSKNALNNLGISSGEEMKIRYREKNFTLTADVNDSINTPWKEVRIHKEDMMNIGIDEGDCVSVRKNE
jgi:hypothetical protein